ncbi:hypothetical protein BGAFAR04_F0008 (plasmid) [Borreliella garinii Far04]|nr:hypothetical protein BGAFAR04_F0008 [Borreliella garinii Far04]
MHRVCRINILKLKIPGYKVLLENASKTKFNKYNINFKIGKTTIPKEPFRVYFRILFLY